jgi:arsenate reductase
MYNREKRCKEPKHMMFLCYRRCTTCQKARKWLEEKGLAFEERDIKSQNPSEAELRKWHKLSGLPLKRFFNTSGSAYKDGNLKDRLPYMSQQEQYRLLANDGMLVKRPIIRAKDIVLVGFDETA